MDLCECRAEFGDIAKTTEATVSSFYVNIKVCKLVYKKKM